MQLISCFICLTQSMHFDYTLRKYISAIRIVVHFQMWWILSFPPPHIHAFSFTIKIAIWIYMTFFLYLQCLVSFCARDLQSLREVGCEDERWMGCQMSWVVASFDTSSDEFLGSVVRDVVILLSAEFSGFYQRRGLLWGIVLPETLVIYIQGYS